MPDRYSIRFTTGAARDMRGFDRDVQKRIGKKIDALAATPRPPGFTKIEGSDRTYRIRIGDCRVLYEIHDAELVVVVIRLDRRDDVYRR